MLMMLLLLLPIKRCSFLRMSCQRTFSNDDRVTERGARRLLVVGLVWVSTPFSRLYGLLCPLLFWLKNSILPLRAAKICGQFTDLAFQKTWQRRRWYFGTNESPFWSILYFRNQISGGGIGGSSALAADAGSSGLKHGVAKMRCMRWSRGFLVI